MATMYRPPFPWFGGKRKVAPIVWQALGDVELYVEPFFGSGSGCGSVRIASSCSRGCYELISSC